MKNILSYILSKRRMKELEETNLIVLQRNQTLHELRKLKSRHIEFRTELLQSLELPRSIRKEDNPTCNTTELQEHIDATPALLHEIAKACHAKNISEPMSTIVAHILSARSMKEGRLIIEQKNLVLEKLHKNMGNNDSFWRELMNSQNQWLFSSKFAKFRATYNTSGLLDALKEDNKLLNIIVRYYNTNQPAWIFNLLGQILSPEIFAILPTIAKNVVLRKLDKDKEDSIEFQSTLIQKANEIIFAPKNKNYESTFDTKGLKDSIEANRKLLYSILCAYYESDNKPWIHNLLGYILHPKRIQETVTTEPIVFAKNRMLNLLANCFEKPNFFQRHLLDRSNPQTFGLENENKEATYNTSELRAIIDAKPDLFNAIVKAYNEQGKPRWMWNILRHILSRGKLTQMDLNKLLRLSRLDRFFTVKALIDPLSVKKLKPYL